MDQDVVVAGAGPVGLAFAAALAGTGLRVVVVDPQPAALLADPPDDGREIALTDRSVATLHSLGAWAAIPPEAIAPLARMRVLNGPSDYVMQFGTGTAAPQPDAGTAATQSGARAAADRPVARLVPNHHLRRALHAAAAPHLRLLPGRRVTALHAAAAATEARLSDGTTLRARLVVAADTRRSRLRALAGIPAALHDYRQHMLVCPVTHDRPHGQAATAWFEYGRTLVTLPLNGGPPGTPPGGGRSSAILTLPPDDAGALLALDDAALGAELTRRYRGRLGAMRPAGARHAVPVLTAYAARFAARRFALLGDAAVGMHPTTAHGLNFGLLGAAALAREVRTALAAGRDPADPAALRRYETAHRRETGAFFAAAEALMRLYAAGEALPARLLRDGALRMGNLPPLRAMLTARMRTPEA